MSYIQKLNENKISDNFKEAMQEVEDIQSGKIQAKTWDDLKYRLEHPSIWDRITTPFCRLSYKVERLYWNIRYTIQRARQGYDSRDVFAFCDTFSRRMAKILIEFKEYNVGMWNLYDDNDNFVRQLSEYEQDLILNEMIQCFQYSDEMALMEARYPLVYGNDEYYDKYQDDYFKKMEECEQDSYKYNKRGLQLLTKYFQQIWY